MGEWTSFVREHLHNAADDPARELDIVEELAQHLAQREAEFVSGGLDPDVARRRVIDELPEWQRVAREIRRADRVRSTAPPPPPHRRGNLFAALWRDVVYASRTLRQSPTYTAVALTVLALGIGAATAIFSIVDAVVLRGLPYDEPNRLVALREQDPKRPTPFPYVAPQDFFDWREQQRSFEALAAALGRLVQIRDAEGHIRTHSARFVTADYFRVLRASPMLGRTFTDAEQALGRDGVAVLDHRFWQARFGGRPDAIGRTLMIDGRPVVIVGVMPAAFTCQVVMANASPELYLPLAAADGDRLRGSRPARGLTVVARLKPRVTLAQASDDMGRIRAGIEAQYPTWAPGVRVQVVTLHEQRFGQVTKWVLMLFGAVGFVLMIACANVANLMLARASIRDREIAIRAALGASRAAIVRGLLIEALLLSLAGAALGGLLAWGGVSAVRGWLPIELTRVASVAVDLRALAGAVVAGLATSIGFGLVPAYRSSRPNLSAALTHRAPSGTGAGTHRLRHALVVSEVALTVVLLVGAGLFISSFAKLLRVDVGFDYRRVVSVLARPFPGGRQHGLDGTLQMLDAVGRLPGVEASAAVSGEVLFSGIRGRTSVAIPGRGDLPAEDAEVSARSVTPTYHRLLGIPLVRGRYLTDADRAGAASVVLINQAAARKYWPGQEALGQRLVVNGRESVVVGIVADVRHWNLEGPVEPECYLALLQGSAGGQMILVRTAGNPLTVLPAIRKAIWSVNNDVPIVGDEGTAEDRLGRLLAQRRFTMTLFALFGVLGLVISAVGVYGVMAYLVAQRTNEIGVRIALGATPGGVVAMVLRRAGALIGIGLAIGTGVALYASRFAKAFLFQLEPNDPRIFVAALAVLALAGLVASVVPARRAAAVDPIVALRRE